MTGEGRTFGVLVANWNGEAFIERCLGSALAAIRRSGVAMDIVVTDDASADRSPEMIARQYPQARLLRWHRNIGYARSVRRGLRAMKSDWVFLLNNDLALQVDFFERLIGALEEYERTERAADARPLFAIGARTRDWETQADNHGGQRALWREGFVVQTPFESEAAAPTDFFQAGACLVHRKRFLELGGMSALYHPGYWEDYDLAWRALRRGWVNLYEPRAVAYHAGKGSMTRLVGREGVALLVRRNHLLFHWVNLHDGALMRRHLLSLPRLVWRGESTTGGADSRGSSGADPGLWGRAFLAALARLPRALRLRRRRLAQGGRSDSAMLRLP